ncbi:cupin domain-containing protein [Aquirufa echingensis]|jgi:quercetin dioxygenase-like cupin family protein|uniref:Cupin domain-containing protein n=1 Tax=Aquirufa echingensis TaxID=3096516 RepID=A0ABW6D453_9BACT
MQTLIHDSSVEWTELGAGIRRKVMAFDDQMMLVKVAFEPGAVGTLHQHPHTQASYVSKGVFDITIDGKTQRLSAGDVYFVPSGEVHGAVCIEKGELIDVFTPMREDFV